MKLPFYPPDPPPGDVDNTENHLKIKVKILLQPPPGPRTKIQADGLPFFGTTVPVFLVFGKLIPVLARKMTPTV
jgi:hypothetical protein